MAESTLIRIPAPRAKQLRALARARATTMAGLIDDLVADAIAKGSIPDETPGLHFKRLPSGDLEIGTDRDRYTFDRYHARSLFDWLGQDATARTNRRKLETFFGTVAVRRAGTSFILEIKRTGRPVARFSLTGRMRIDVRRQIANAYKDDRWSREDFKE